MFAQIFLGSTILKYKALIHKNMRVGLDRSPSLTHFARSTIVIECYSHLLVLHPGLKPCPWIYIPTLKLSLVMNGDFPISGESKLPN